MYEATIAELGLESCAVVEGDWSAGSGWRAAREVIAHGNDAVLVSLGAHGALLVTTDACLWAGGPPLVPLSTVGAGDSTLAGYLATDGPPADRLRLAVAWGRAAVLLPGSAVPEPSDVAAVIDDVRVIDQPDPTLALKEL